MISSSHKRMFRTFTAALASTVFVFVLVSVHVCFAKRAKIPVLLQVTHNTVGDVSAPKLRSERGETIVFASDGDVLGAAPGHREIYIYDTASGVTSAVTNTAGGESYDPARSTDTTASPREEQVLFVSTADLDPSVGNADGNPEIFMWELRTGVYRQITDTLPPVVNSTPYASDAGACIVFASTGDLHDNDGSDPGHPDTGWSNPDGSQEIFLLMIDNDNQPVVGSLTQVSNGPAGTTSWSPVVGDYYFPRQCQQTFYLSDYDQTAEGAVGTNVYRYKRGAGSVFSMIINRRENSFGLPLGSSAAPVVYGPPYISGASRFATGPWIVYSTAADVLNNQNAAENVFKHRIQHPRTRQYTAVSPPFYTRNPATSDGGKWVAFESNGELINPKRKVRGGGEPPFNADQNQEIFRTQGNRRMAQITQSQGCENGLASIQDNGTSIAFRSTCDLVPGGNPSGVPQIFFYHQVTDDDPLLQPGNCLVANGCCSEANGCYQRIDGRALKVPKKNCLSRRRGC